jgi:hypothetical protein
MLQKSWYAYSKVAMISLFLCHRAEMWAWSQKSRLRVSPSGHASDTRAKGTILLHASLFLWLASPCQVLFNVHAIRSCRLPSLHPAGCWPAAPPWERE